MTPVSQKHVDITKKHRHMSGITSTQSTYPGSSNGRTRAFGAWNIGSSPIPGANLFTARRELSRIFAKPPRTPANQIIRRGL